MKITLSEFETCLKDVSFPLIVATSGGADSLALLLLASKLAQLKGGRVIALTVDHGLRPESKNEVRWLQQWTQEKGIEHIILEWQGVKPTSRLQEKARNARYHLLINWCKTNHMSSLLLGHHQQDQEETFWLRLSSGSGLEGLSGIKKQVSREGITFLRPLLAFSKERLKATLINEKQTWIEDPSNSNQRFFRGRLRTFLEKEGLSSQRLTHIMEKLQVDADFINSSLQKTLNTTVFLHNPGYITLERKAFEDLHPALVKRLLSLLMQWFSGAFYPPRSTQINTILNKINSFSSFTVGGIYWVPQQTQISLFREVAVIKENFSLSLLQEETLWDQRFWIDPHIKDHVPEEVVLAPLRSIPSFKKNIASSIPSSAWPSLPTLWIKEKIVSIPHLCYNVDCAEDIQKYIYIKPLFHNSLRFTI